MMSIETEDVYQSESKFKQGDVIYVKRHKNLRGVVMYVYDFDSSHNEYRYIVILFSSPNTRIYLESSIDKIQGNNQ